MKIGINIKKIISTFQESINYFSTKVLQNENNIANHETRITTLENSPGGEGSTILNSYTLKLFDVMNNSIYEFNVNSIGNDVFLNIEFEVPNNSTLTIVKSSTATAEDTVNIRCKYYRYTYE